MKSNQLYLLYGATWTGGSSWWRRGLCAAPFSCEPSTTKLNLVATERPPPPPPPPPPRITPLLPSFTLYLLLLLSFPISAVISVDRHVGRPDGGSRPWQAAPPAPPCRVRVAAGVCGPSEPFQPRPCTPPLYEQLPGAARAATAPADAPPAPTHHGCCSPSPPPIGFPHAPTPVIRGTSAPPPPNDPCRRVCSPSTLPWPPP